MPSEPVPAEGAQPSLPATPAAETPPSHDYYDDPYSDYGEGYTSSASASPTTALAAATAPPVEPAATGGGPPGPPGGGSGGGDEPEGDEEGMVRMSFFEHLGELRTRLLYAISGLVVAFLVCLFFANKLWEIVSRPAVSALTELGVKPPVLIITAPMEYFNNVWVKLPLLTSLFLASPWLLYQLWAFIAPGLYKKERRWAVPFVVSTAGLFVLGGVFAYFIAFRFALVFLLGLGIGNQVQPMVRVEDYLDIFVNVMLGIGIVFELPVLIFFLALIRVVTSGFLMRNIRYAILVIHIIAAVVTPTPDVFNMELFALPMCLLFFVGVGAAYLLELRRDKKRFPWGPVLKYLVYAAAVIGAALYFMHLRYGYHFVRHLPWFVR